MTRPTYRPRTVAILIALALLFAAVGVVEFYVAQRNDTDRPTSAERSAVQQAAADAVRALMTFSPADPPTQPEVARRLTGHLAAEYRTQGADLILPNAVDSRTTMSASVIGAAVSSYATHDARVLVFVDQQVGVPGLTTQAQRVTVARWAVMHRVEHTWKLSDLDLVDAGGTR